MIEVLKQMVEALENDYIVEWPAMNRPKKVEEKRQEAIQAGNEAITSLHQAIAELESQEPVAYLSNKRQRLNIELKPHTFVEIPTATDWEMPLYTHPPQPAKPIPCANHCESTAFEIVIKNLQGEIERLKAPQRTEQNFCPRCGKRTKDLTHIHTCTPPQD